MRVNLNGKRIRYPVDGRPYLNRHFEPIPSDKSELTIKNIDRQNGWAVLSFITETGDIYIHHQIWEDQAFKLEKSFRYFDIELHPSSIKLNDHFSFDLEMA